MREGDREGTWPLEVPLNREGQVRTIFAAHGGVLSAGPHPEWQSRSGLRGLSSAQSELGSWGSPGPGWQGDARQG